MSTNIANNNNFMYPEMQYHFRINRNVNLCKNKQNYLIEYYKKRERWVDANDITEEYNSCVILLNYIHSYMFGGSNQNVYEYITKPLISMSNRIIIIDGDLDFDEDVWDCVDYYQKGFDSPDENDEDFTPEQIQLQLKITDMIHKITSNPNFINIYAQSIMHGEFTRN